jgi:hypothetical protein
MNRGDGEGSAGKSGEPRHGDGAASSTRGGPRANGLVVLFSIVAVGLLTGAVFYRWKRGQMDADVAREIAAAPQSPQERVDLWLELAGPQIHHRLAVVARFSPALPWLVTHAVAREGGPPELWGIDCAALPLELAHREGLQVVIELPAPRALGRAELAADQQSRVPLFAPWTGIDPAARLKSLALYLLEGMPAALARDIPGAEIVVRVAGG